MGGVNQLISKDFVSLHQHYENVLSRFGINANGNFTIDDVEFAGSGGGGVLVYNTLAELQTTYPNGHTQPAWVVVENDWYYWDGVIQQPADTTAPVITASSSGGTFTSAQSVTLSADETATIYYTLDGSTPTTSSTVYSSAISIGSTSTLKFFGKDAAGNSSAVQSISFTINAPDTTAPTVTISPAAGTFASTQSITLTANEPSTIYYTTDGSTPTTSSTVYSSPISISATTTLKYFAKDTAGNSSVVQTAIYTIDNVAPVVTASPAAGTYTSTQSVTLSTEAGATIYYTTNGTTPTTASTVYSVPIAISATTTLQFIGKDAVGNVSVPVAATYTINIPDTTPPTVTASPVGGTFTSSQNVTLTANETATIYYTVDGTTPTYPVSGTTQTYSGPITLATTTTLKYIGRDTAGNVSAVQSQSYTINVEVLSPNVLSFDGVSNIVSVPHNSTIAVDGDFTLEARAKIEGTGGTPNGGFALIAGKFNATPGGFAFFYKPSTNTIEFNVKNGGSMKQIQSPVITKDTKEYALKGVLKNGNMEFFVDGVSAGVLTGVLTPTTGTTNFTIGNGYGAFKGTASNIKLTNSAGVVVGKWNLDEGTGTTANDTSGNGFNGTITGATWATR